jgi:hypothetical protein
MGLAQGVEAAAEDRALRGRTLSADAALQTAGGAATGSPPAYAAWFLPEQAKAKNPRGFGGQSHPISSIADQREIKSYGLELTPTHWSV